MSGTFQPVCGVLIVGAALSTAGLVVRGALPENGPLDVAAERIEPLHREKAPAGPNDWLSNHDEPGQTFQQYVRSRPNRPTAEHTTLYLQPLGEFGPTQRRLIGRTAELLSRFYGLPTQVLDPLGLDVIPPSPT